MGWCDMRMSMLLWWVSFSDLNLNIKTVQKSLCHNSHMKSRRNRHTQCLHIVLQYIWDLKTKSQLVSKYLADDASRETTHVCRTTIPRDPTQPSRQWEFGCLLKAHQEGKRTKKSTTRLRKFKSLVPYISISYRDIGECNKSSARGMQVICNSPKNYDNEATFIPRAMRIVKAVKHSAWELSRLLSTRWPITKRELVVPAMR